jgi:subtilase family serine protease
LVENCDRGLDSHFSLSQSGASVASRCGHAEVHSGLEHSAAAHILRIDPSRTIFGKLLSELVPLDARNSATAPFVEPRAHTNFAEYQVFGDPETPPGIACLYFDGRNSDKACKTHNLMLQNATGGNQGTIAIVVAYNHDKDIVLGDLKSFDTMFGVKELNSEFYIYTPNGGAIANDPSAGSGWNLETSLDLEWAHAMAPDAKLILVESEDVQFSSLSQAVDMAGQKVQAAGGGVVSMSWSFFDTADSPIGDSYRQQFDNILKSYDKVTFVASSGDWGVVEYPASSPYVIAVGGTQLERDDNGSFVRESAWNDSGAGLSAYSRPPFQNGIASIPSDRRGIADISAIADSNKGGIEILTNSMGRIGVSGTSVATPIVAGLILNARSRPNQSFKGTSEQQAAIYGNLKTLAQTVFNAISVGWCGLSHFQCKSGWNFCGGVGSPKGLAGFYSSAQN